MVTGCTGYIGSYLCMGLVRGGQEVLGVCPDRLHPVAQSLEKAGVLIYVGDLTQAETFEKLARNIRLDSVKTVYQMAGIHASLPKMRELYVTGVQRLVSLFEDFTPPYFVFTSSGAVPFSNPEHVRYHPFGAINAEMEQCIAQMHVHSAVVRIAEVYGWGKMNPFRHLNSGISLLGHGKNIAAKIFIEDVVAMLLRISEVKPDGLFEMCDDLQVTQRSFYNYAEELAGCKFVNWSGDQDLAAENRLWQSIHGLRTLPIQMDNGALKRELQYKLRYPTYHSGLKDLYLQHIETRG